MRFEVWGLENKIDNQMQLDYKFMEYIYLIKTESLYHVGFRVPLDSTLNPNPKTL